MHKHHQETIVSAYYAVTQIILINNGIFHKHRRPVFYFRYFTRENPIPGPLPLPIVGNLLFATDLSNYCFKLGKKYGDIFEIWMGNERWIILARGDLVEKIMNPSTKSSFFKRMGANGNLVELGLSASGILFNHDAPSWRLNRKFLTQAVMLPQFQDELVLFAQDVFAGAEDYLFSLKPNEELDFSKWAVDFTTDIAFKITTGKPSGTLGKNFKKASSELEQSTPFPNAEEFVQRLGRWPAGLVYILLIPSWLRHCVPGLRHFNNKILENTHWLEREVTSMIKNKKTELEMTGKEEAVSSNLLTLLLMANHADKVAKFENPSFLSEVDIREIIIEVMVAGIDTTAHSICYIIYYLCHYPETKALFLEEIEKVLGSDPDRKVQYDDLEKLVYCEAIIKEAARCTTLIPLVGRHTSAEEEIGGYKWKEGTFFWLHMHGIHQNSAQWKDPKRFDPTRFLKDANGAEGIEKYSFLPFGGGTRLCPGRHLAMAQMKVMMVCLFRKFEIQLVDMDAPLKVTYGGINGCRDFRIFVRPRAMLKN
ncbi:hypothetical protein G9A89_003974 [Geosiphon pyriformis]|nr:hypothetical protein G9A89_003974 [Geosiphon pyriformis]